MLMTIIRKLKAEDSSKVKYFRLDNAGENLGLKSKIEAEVYPSNWNLLVPKPKNKMNKLKEVLQLSGVE
jgi:hypothetical protein